MKYLVGFTPFFSSLCFHIVSILQSHHRDLVNFSLSLILKTSAGKTATEFKTGFYYPYLFDS